MNVPVNGQDGQHDNPSQMVQKPVKNKVLDSQKLHAKQTGKKVKKAKVVRPDKIEEMESMEQPKKLRRNNQGFPIFTFSSRGAAQLRGSIQTVQGELNASRNTFVLLNSSCNDYKDSAARFTTKFQDFQNSSKKQIKEINDIEKNIGESIGKLKKTSEEIDQIIQRLNPNFQLSVVVESIHIEAPSVKLSQHEPQITSPQTKSIEQTQTPSSSGISPTPAYMREVVEMEDAPIFDRLPRRDL